MNFLSDTEMKLRQAYLYNALAFHIKGQQEWISMKQKAWLISHEITSHTSPADISPVEI